MSIPPGVFDILPVDPQEQWRSSYIWEQVETIIRQTTKTYGFHEIRTPLFERTELFQRGVGGTSDIVSKEMYTFVDKGGRSLSLRPEGTASVMRAFIDHHMEQQASVHKLFYLAPMFRYERSQAGRYRQHHQFGAEVIGAASAEQDAEIIDLIYTVYQKLGLKNLQVNLNSLGTPACRVAYRQALQSYLHASYNELSQDSQNRFEANPLRILDSKDPKDRQLLEKAPSILDFLDEESKDHFEEVKKFLNLIKIPYTINSQLVRGLDYYNKTVFEIVANELGAQNSIAGGGRYDGLLKTLGGPDLPSIGFGAGLERVIQTMLGQKAPIHPPSVPVLFLIALGEEAMKECFTLLRSLRLQGVAACMDYSGKKLSKVMQLANQIGAKYVTIVGDNEIQDRVVELKEMATGEKTKVPIENLGRILQVESTSSDFVKLWQDLATPFASNSEAQFFMNKLNQSIEHANKTADELTILAQQFQDLLKK